MAARASTLAVLVGFLAVAAARAQDGGPAVAPEEAEAGSAAAASAVEGAEGAENGNADLAEADPLSTTPVDEEVVVRGQLTRGALRVQIELAEEAFYGRFNEINSDDELDIHCREVVELGSRIPRRRCEPNFWRTAQTEFAQDTVIALQGGFAGIPQQALSRANYMHLELEKEMRELAGTDPGLREALARLVTLQQAYAADGDE